MYTQKLKTACALLLICLVAFTAGCSSSVNAIKNRKLKVEAKMSDSIFLDAETLTDAPKIFVRVANTSDFQEIDFANLLRERLSSMGYTVTMRAKEAQYHVTANLLYMGEKKEGMDPDRMMAAGFGGAALGATAAAISGSNLRGAGAAGMVAGLAVAAGDGIVGGIWHVDEYFGMVDLQIKEEVEGGVTGVQTASLQDGTSTTMETTRNVAQKRQEYRTRILVKAKQTRINREEALGTISDRLTAQISGMFRI